MRVFWATLLLSLLSPVSSPADDRRWENPVYTSVDEAVAAARVEAAGLGSHSSHAARLFVDMTLAEGDMPRSRGNSSMARRVVGDFVVTHPSSYLRNEPQRVTVERFVGEMPGQRDVLERRLARFGYPETPGLVFIRLVDSVDAFVDLNRASSDRMSQVGGVTYYCRYVVLPLSYVGEENVRELRLAAARNPSINVDDTIGRWQRESFSSLVNTFRHELVHVRTNSTLDVPAYSNRARYPTWFHEGTATYLSADPRSGLSKAYQEYQGMFFYLAQRHGIRRLQEFYMAVFGGQDVRTALATVYSISGTDQLVTLSGRWHRAKEAAKTVIWIAALAIVLGALRGRDRPYIGALQLLVSAAVMLAAITGLAEHLYGLRGPNVVLVAKLAMGGAAVVMGYLGARRVRRHRQRGSVTA